jgi:hypothetical protein
MPLQNARTGGAYYKGGGSKTTDTGDDNTANNSGGTPGHSVTQRPIPGPENPGPPIALKRALARKSGPALSGPGLPNRNTTGAGTVE